MKKSVIAMGAGAFVLVTALLCTNPDGKMYQKQKHFDSANDVITQLESNKIIEEDDMKSGETDAFKECLSKRKRLTDSEIGFKRIKVKKIEDLDEEKRKSILEDYNKAQERLAMPYKPTKIEPIRLDIIGVSDRYKDNTKVDIEDDFTIDLVLVDEGEGMVIDYYVQHANENEKDKEGRRNVEG